MISVLITADSRYPVNRKLLRAEVVGRLTEEGIVTDTTVSVAVVGDRKMAELHQKYMGLSGTTDVLSFPYVDQASNPHPAGARYVMPAESGIILGDIVISYPQVVKQAKEKNVLIDEEVKFLVLHGLEHLLGRHHQ